MDRYVITIILVCAFACVVFAESEEEGYIKGDRPGKESGPTQAYFYVFVVDIDDIDGPGQSFSANIFLRLHWKSSAWPVKITPCGQFRWRRCGTPV